MANIYMGNLFFTAPKTGFLAAGGWSESYLIQAADYTGADASLSDIASKRLATLSPDCALIGSRLSDTAIKGDSSPTGIVPGPGTYTLTPPSTSYLTDVALRVHFFAATSKRSKRFLHCVPIDSVTPNGTYSASATFATAVLNFIASVLANAMMGTRIKGAVTPPFYSVSTYSSGAVDGTEKRALGRPFGQRRGRRLIA